MRIVHIVLPGASEYEKKSQRIDFETLGREHEVLLAEDLRNVPSADVAQVYGPRTLLPRLRMPYIATARHRRRFRLRPAALLVSPVKHEQFEYLPEAVAQAWFGGAPAPSPAPAPPRAAALHTIGSFLRPSIRPIVEQTVPRLHRTREDVEWLLLERAPSPAELSQFDAWVDPVIDEGDFDGFVAEALVSGKPVIASRTPINIQRLEKGRTGFLVPPGDANELTHAILTALFKPEVAQQRTEAARQTISKFVPRQRIRVLTHILETVRP